MKKQIINIVGPVSPKISHVDPNLFTIFVDGGLNFRNSEFLQSLSIGDNDSSELPLEIKLSVDKERSDLFYAVMEMAKMGVKSAKLYGFIGERLDHQLLLIGDLLRLSQEHELSFELYEGAIKRLDILPSGEHHFIHRGCFSVFTLEKQKVLYSGDCKYPEDKEYPQYLIPFSSHGLSNESWSQFQLKAEKAICVFYPPESP